MKCTPEFEDKVRKTIIYVVLPVTWLFCWMVWFFVYFTGYELTINQETLYDMWVFFHFLALTVPFLAWVAGGFKICKGEEQ